MNDHKRKRRSLFALGNRRALELFAVLVVLVPTSLAQGPQPKPGAQQLKNVPEAPEPKLMRDVPNYKPPSGGDRVKWVLVSTFGPESLAAGVFSAGWGTMLNSPEEYGPHWDGFAKRYGMRFTGVATSNVMEAGLGAIWGEDPHYVRCGSCGFGHRVKHIFWMTVVAPNREGHMMPAYARFIAYPGNNFLSNTWRVSSEATTSKALERTAYGFLGKVGSNTFSEFWPDVRKAVFKK